MDASQEIGINSVIAAPLTARGQRLGVLSLALSGLTVREDAKHYVADDRDLVAAIASRVAIAIDNAHALRGGTSHRARLPEQPAAASAADARRPRGRLPVRARQAAGEPRPGHPDPGRRRLVRHHPAVGRAGRHRDRRRRGPRCPRRRDHGPAQVRAARLRAGRQAASRHPAQAGRVVLADDRRRWPTRWRSRRS